MVKSPYSLEHLPNKNLQLVFMFGLAIKAH